MSEKSTDISANDRNIAWRIPAWTRLSLLNLVIVSTLGLTLRYKGAFSLPDLDYKYLLNSHSHFAFAGWVTTALFTALLYILPVSAQTPSRNYRYQFWLSQLSSFGMLVSFLWQGYGPAAITFSTLSIVFSYWFAIRYWKDAKRANWPPLVKTCVQFALAFLVLSSMGPLLLAYSLARAIGGSDFYVNSIYLYLHFQYNGWFTFGVFALFFWSANRHNLPLNIKASKWFVNLMGIACVPSYTLSLLWTEPPIWIWVLGSAAAIMQMTALILLVNTSFRERRAWARSLPEPTKFLWALSFIAFSIKLALQSLSVIPAMGRLAFAHRPVIIAYLHLVLLGFVTLFLIGYFLFEGLLRVRTQSAKLGLGTFVAGVFANEVVLLIQSLMVLFDMSWMSVNYYLFGAAVLLFGGLLLFFCGQLQGRMSRQIQVDAGKPHFDPQKGGFAAPGASLSPFAEPV